MGYYVLAVCAACLTAIGQVALKQFSLRMNGISIRRFLNSFFILSVCSFLMSFILSVIALRVLDFTVYYTLTSLNFAFIAILSAWFLNEKLDLYKISGILLIILGLVIFNF